MKDQEHKKELTSEETLKIEQDNTQTESDEDYSIEINSIGFPDIDIKKQMGCGG